MMDSKKIVDLPPLPRETCVVTWDGFFKRAALLFDKIWASRGSSILEKVPSDITFRINKIDQEAALPTANLINDFAERHSVKSSSELDDSDSFITKLLRITADAYSAHGIQTIPLYSTTTQFTNDFPQGQTFVYQAILQNIGLPSEEYISWQQVVDFRNDKDAKWKYRALRAWLVDGSKANSVAEATDIIGKKIDDYEWAIRKHGLKTVSGTLTEILDSKTFSTILIGAGLAGFIGGPVWSAIAGGAITFSKLALSLSEQLIDLEDTKRKEHAEVALIYDIRKEFGKP